MIGDKYKVKVDCSNGQYNLKRGDILTETDGYNYETENRENAGEFNDIVHDIYGFICDAGSTFAKTNLEKI